jgi:hypothetical protein
MIYFLLFFKHIWKTNLERHVLFHVFPFLDPLSFVKQSREPEGELRKRKQKTPGNDKRDQERGDAFVYPADRLLGDVLYHKHANRYGGNHHTDHHDHTDDDTEPDGIETEF